MAIPAKPTTLSPHGVLDGNIAPADVHAGCPIRPNCLYLSVPPASYPTTGLPRRRAAPAGRLHARTVPALVITSAAAYEYDTIDTVWFSPGNPLVADISRAPLSHPKAAPVAAGPTWPLVVDTETDRTPAVKRTLRPEPQPQRPIGPAI